MKIRPQVRIFNEGCNTRNAARYRLAASVSAGHENNTVRFSKRFWLHRGSFQVVEKQFAHCAASCGCWEIFEICEMLVPGTSDLQATSKLVRPFRCEAFWRYILAELAQRH